MFKKKLCPKCKTGKYTYELDKRSTECPYIGCYRNNRCSMFVRIEPKKDGFWAQIFKKITPQNKHCAVILSQSNL